MEEFSASTRQNSLDSQAPDRVYDPVPSALGAGGSQRLSAMFDLPQ
jgi:hypothetical protein